MQLTERDVGILRDLSRFQALTVDQVARRHFGAVNTAANRLAQLVSAGYVRVERPVFRGRAAYLTSPAGARLAGLDLPAARFSPVVLPHRLAVADLAEALLARHPGASWVTERELRSDAMRTVRDSRYGRLLFGTPHVPDGLLMLPDGPKSGVAVELEVTVKKADRYRGILRWYGGDLRYERVWWFGATPAICRRMTEAVERERMTDFVRVEPLPAGVTVSRWG